MNRKHLLWWIFDWMARESPETLARLLAECDGDFGGGATQTVNGAIKEAFDRYRVAKQGDMP